MKKTVKICIYNKSSSKNDVLLGNGDAILDNICLECKVHENLDGTYEIDAEFIIDNEGLWQHIEEEAILKVRLDYGYEYFRITQPRKTSNRIIVYGRQVTIYETMHLWLTDVRPENQDGAGALHWILDNATGIKELEVMSDIQTVSTAYYMDMNMYEALHDCDQSFFNRWGGEIQRRGYTLRINQRIGTDRGVEIRSRKNLTGFEANTNIDNVVTRIKPKGFDGITIDGYVDSEYINKYPRIKTKEIKYDNVKVMDSENTDGGYETLEEAQAELTRLAKLEFTENKIDVITAEYNISFVDLSKTEEYKEYVQAERVYLGDTVNVYEEKLDINVSVRAIDRVYDVLGERVEEIKLSNKDINKLHSINDILTDILKGVQENDNSLQLYIQNIINSGIQDSYVFYNKAELVICDSPEIENAINVWRFNRGGLAHSSNGYSGPYNVAITYDGKINADMILAGLIKGNYIDARNLTVTRTDGTKTLEITAGGDVNLNVASLSINSTGMTDYIQAKSGNNLLRGMSEFDGKTKLILTATRDDYYEIFNAYVDLEKDIVYTMSFESSGYYGTESGTDTVEAYLMKDKGYTTIIKIESKAYTFTAPATGRYYLRLDINKINMSHSFWCMQVVKGGEAGDWHPNKNDLSELQTRVSNVETKVTPTSITNSVSEALANGTVLNTVSTIVDKNGFTVKNGKIIVQNSSGTDVMWVDTTGQLATDHLTVYGGERLGNIEVAGIGNKGIVIRSTDGGDRYIDFSHNPINTSFENESRNGNLVRLWAQDDTFLILPPKKLKINAINPDNTKLTSVIFDSNLVETNGELKSTVQVSSPSAYHSKMYAYNTDNIDFMSPVYFDQNIQLNGTITSSKDISTSALIQSPNGEFNYIATYNKENLDFNSRVYLGQGGIFNGNIESWTDINMTGHSIYNQSDRTLKENIEYIKDVSVTNSNCDINSNISLDELYNFIRDDISLATYNFTGSEDKKIGFILQDTISSYNSTVDYLVTPKNGDILTYNMTNYLNIIAGALKCLINKFENSHKGEE